MAKVFSFLSPDGGTRVTCGDAGGGRDLLCNPNAEAVTVEVPPPRVCLVQLATMANGLTTKNLGVLGRTERPIPIFAKSRKTYLTIPELIRLVTMIH